MCHVSVGRFCSLHNSFCVTSLCISVHYLFHCFRLLFTGDTFKFCNPLKRFFKKMRGILHSLCILMILYFVNSKMFNSLVMQQSRTNNKAVN